MSLATRCPNCKTVFQVNEELLKQRSGTVRCGICHTLFNGIDNLVGRIAPQNADQPAASGQDAVAEKTVSAQPAPQIPPTSAPAVKVGEPPQATGNDEDDYDDEEPLPLDDRLKEAFNRQLETISLDLDEIPEATTVPAQVTAVTSAAVATKNSQQSAPAQHDTAQPPAPVQVPAQAQDKPTDEKASGELIRNIHEKEKKSRISSILWLIGVIVLLFVLFGQALYFYSERIVTWWPPAKGLVESTCEVLSCPAGQPVSPAVAVHIKYGELEPADKPGHFTQTVALRNSSQTAQPFPSLVMEIHDSGNKILSRKVLEPAAYLPEKNGAQELSASAETSFQLNIEFQHDSPISSRIMILHH